jgi:putative hydrolases of HD superfamily
MAPALFCLKNCMLNWKNISAVGILKRMINPLDNYISSGDERLDQQLKFIAEIDKMTKIYRHTLHVDGSGRENDAEHSWHLAVMAMMLGEYFQDTPDVNRAVKMVIVHDLIEIYAGDTFAYDKAGNETKQMREKNAADKLFSQLPEDQNEMFRALWEEFDAVQTADARFANCMDRIQPFLHNTLTEGATWKEAHACRADVEKRMETVSKNMPRLREWITSNLDNAVMKGWLTA